VLSYAQKYTVWQSTWNLPTWTSQRYYTVVARAADLGTNLCTGVTSQFLFDTDFPVTTVNQPQVNVSYSPARPLALVSGTAVDVPVDPLAGINQVQVRVMRSSDSLYWRVSDSSWTAASSWNVAASTPGSGSKADWSFAQPSTQWQNETNYVINSRGLDLAGNEARPVVAEQPQQRAQQVLRLAEVPLRGVGGDRIAARR